MEKNKTNILYKFLYFVFFAILIHQPISAKEFTVVIDPGHGGHDPGAVGKISKEKDINLKVALKVGGMIEQKCKDVKVIYTRKTDVFVPLDRRAKIANDAKADLFISIHTNAVGKGKIVRGTETFTLGLARSEANLEIAKRENSVILIEEDYQEKYEGFNPKSSESYIMFEFIQDKHMEQSVKLAKLIQEQFKNHAKRIDRGVHQAGFLVLRATTMPSILVELGYISTPDEEKYLNSKEGIDKLSTGIYNAFLSYKNENHLPVNIGKNSTSSSSSNSSNNKNQTEIKTSGTSTSSANKPVFKIQILASSKKLNKNDKQFKGVSPVDYYQENGMYKYTYMESTDYNEVLRGKKNINAKFKDAFIIAFKNGKKMNVQEAIKEFQTQKNKL